MRASDLLDTGIWGLIKHLDLFRGLNLEYYYKISFQLIRNDLSQDRVLCEVGELQVKFKVELRPMLGPSIMGIK